MLPRSRSIYSRARVYAGFSQEAAAELLNLSVRALADYESGQRRPPAQTVDQMASLYAAPGLRLDHARETDELGMIPQSATACSIEQATLRIGKCLRRLRQNDDAGQLVEIAEDGVVDADEEADYRRITEDMRELRAAILALEHCQQSTKKERPTAGTVKRSSSAGIHPENHSKNSIAGKSSERKENFSRDGGVEK